MIYIFFNVLKNIFNFIPAAKNMEGESKSVKVDKWDGSALKNALDDHVKKVDIKYGKRK